MAEFLKHAIKLEHGTTIFGLDWISARQNASTHLLSLSSNGTICRSTQGDTYELVSCTCARSSLRPESPETPKSLASVLKNMVTYPPLTHTFLKRPFLKISKSIHIPPPPFAEIQKHSIS